MRALADWWDAVELWVTQLPFPFQVLLAIVVVLPACWALATLVDVVVGAVGSVLLPQRSRSAQQADPDPGAAAALLDVSSMEIRDVVPAARERAPDLVPEARLDGVDGR